MWISNGRHVVALLIAAATLLPAGLGQDERKGPADPDLRRPREEVFVKAYSVGDLTGRQKADRLGQIAANRSVGDARRLDALRELQEIEASGSIETASNELTELVRRMLNPGFDPERQSLAIGDGSELLMSGNRMQHNSLRLLLKSRRSDDRHIELTVRIYELPAPDALPPWLSKRGDRDDRDTRSSYWSWLMERLQALGVGTPTYERVVTAETGRPIRVALTRRVPVVADYRRRTLVDSNETVLEPVLEEIQEGPVIDVLIGQFQTKQLVVKANVEHRGVRRPIPTRSVLFETGDEVVLQQPQIDVVRGSAAIHCGFGTPVLMATVAPLPREPRKDYVVELVVVRK